MTTREEKKTAIKESVSKLLNEVTPETVFDAILTSWKKTQIGDGLNFDEVKDAIHEAFKDHWPARPGNQS